MINEDGFLSFKGKDYLIVTLDFETYYGTGYSLSKPDFNTYKYVTHEQFKIHGVGIQTGSDDPVYYTEYGLDDFRELLETLSDDHNVALLCHNTHFDALVLHHHFDWHPDLYLDTQAMSQGMFVGYPANLKDLCIRLWPNGEVRKGDELADFKNKRELSDAEADTLADYCRNDVAITYQCFTRMEPHYPDDELHLIHLTCRFNAEPWFEVDRDLVQVEIDAQKADEYAALAAAKAQYGLSKAQLASDKQFLAWLKARGVQVGTKLNPKGQEIAALGQKDWEYQKMCAAYPELATVWTARQNTKSNIQLSRAQWFKAVAEWWGGQMPVPLKYYGADTGRWSGQEKLNLQNLPRIAGPDSGRLRRSLVAPEGWAVVVRDLSNIEGRVLAWIAGQADKLERFRADQCVYLYLASRVYGIPFESMSKKTHAQERTVGKVAELGLGYGLGRDGFWIALNTGAGGTRIEASHEFATSIHTTYRATNDKIVEFWRRCDQYIADMYIGKSYQDGPLTIGKNHILLPNGMALQYPNLQAFEDRYGHQYRFGPKGAHRKIYGSHLTENIVQALARVILGEQMLEIEGRLDENYGLDVARLVHCVHDEAIAIVPEPEAEATYQMMGEVMSTSPRWAPDLPLLSEGGYAREYSK